MVTVKLSNGYEIPRFFLGVLNMKTQESMDAGVKAAAEAGIRGFDNAFRYRNEKEFGIALKNSGLARKDVFITTKSRMLRHDYDDAIDTVYSQMRVIGVNYFDLYLLHWPQPAKPALYLKAWKALEDLYKDGVIRAIGVSNFFVPHLEKVFAECEIKPMVDQIQVHPFYYNKEVIEFCQKNDILVQAWWPFMEGKALKEPIVVQLAEKYGQSTAAIVLNWHYAKGIGPIGGSSNPDHIRDFVTADNFKLSDEDVALIDTLECGKGLMPRGRIYDPENFPMMW